MSDQKENSNPLTWWTNYWLFTIFIVVFISVFGISTDIRNVGQKLDKLIAIEQSKTNQVYTIPIVITNK